MMRQRVAALACAAASSLALSAPGRAAPLQFAGQLDLHAGYANNPYLDIGDRNRGSSVLTGATLSGTITRPTEFGTSALFGSANYDYNFNHYGHAENYLIGLRHQQRLSSALTAQGSVTYQDTKNPPVGYTTLGASTSLVTDPGVVVGTLDPATIGQHTRQIQADAGLTWQPTARDQFSADVGYSHATYSGPFGSDYDQYSATGGYLRTLNARTKVGVQIGVVQSDSQFYGSSHSYQASLQLVQQLSPAWVFNGSLGGIFQRGKASPGFTASLCGTYPRYTLCVSAARQSSPSGIGGLSTNLVFDASGTYQLTARDHLSGTLDYSRSSSRQSVLVPVQRYYGASASYTHDLTQRLSVGASARYQRRDYGGLAIPSATGNGRARGYSVTGNVIYKFGRLS